MSSSSLHANWSMTAGAGLSKNPSQSGPQSFTPIDVATVDSGRTSTSPPPEIPESHPNIPKSRHTTTYKKRKIYVDVDDLPSWGVNANASSTGSTKKPVFYNEIFLGFGTNMQPNLPLVIPPRQWLSPPTD